MGVEAAGKNVPASYTSRPRGEIAGIPTFPYILPVNIVSGDDEFVRTAALRATPRLRGGRGDFWQRRDYSDEFVRPDVTSRMADLSMAISVSVVRQLSKAA